VDPRIGFSSLDGLLDEAVASGIVPGISVCVRSATEVLHLHTVGAAELRPDSRPAAHQSVWDLASLTKVLATAPIAMAMVAEGLLDLDAPINHTLLGAPTGVTAAHLLSHSAGFPPWAPLYESLGAVPPGTEGARQKILNMAMSTPLVSAPGEAYSYSDLGFLTLGALLEALSGNTLKALFEQYVRGPSGVDLRFGWPGAAASEDCPVRGAVVVGEVHDLNAWSMGGVSSHAGLFGTASSVAAAAAWQLRAWAGEGREGLDPATVQRFFSETGPGSHHLGWDGPSPGGSAGPLWPKDGVGHLAFTGCSVWIAPRFDCVVAIVSNRIHPYIEGGAVPDAPIHPRYAAFRRLRPAVHTAVIEALIGSSDWPQ